MNDSFQSAITQLRREKGLSQKAVAAQLNTSQALLSHYENGVRECGLDFVVRIARFYGVTCDYLLGNSSSRDGLPAYESDDLIPTEQLEQISPNVILNAVHELLQQAENGDEAWRRELKQLIVLGIYRTMLACLPIDNSGGAAAFACKSSFCDALIKLTEAKIMNDAPPEKLNKSPASPLTALADSAESCLEQRRLRD